MAEKIHIKTAASPAQRARALLDDWCHTTQDVDVDLSVGTTDTDQTIMVIQIDGGSPHAMTAYEARTLAMSMQDLLDSAPNQQEIADLILLLRLGADQVDQLKTEDAATLQTKALAN